MSKGTWVMVFLAGALATTTACATREQWIEWAKYDSHFASWKHMGFSLRQGPGAEPKVTRRDIEKAKTEGWWGEAIVVTPDQIFQD